MFRKILTYFGYTLLVTMLGGYLFFCTLLEKQNRAKEVCRNIKVTLLDSAVNRFVTRDEVIGIVEGFMGKTIGKPIREIDLNNIEELLDKRSAIKKSEVSLTRSGRMNIDITQRRPVLRIQTKNGGFYVDESEYIFPLVETFTSYVPIVSGNIPVIINAQHRGKALEDENNWISQILRMGYYLDEHPFWNAQIEQIYVDPGGDILLYPRVGNHKIIFGDLNDIDEKFTKLYAFYKNIIPEEGWEKYSSVNLKYRNQIVCKLNKVNKTL